MGMEPDHRPVDRCDIGGGDAVAGRDVEANEAAGTTLHDFR